MGIVDGHKQDESDDDNEEERAVRAMAIMPGGDRSDPELVKIDALVEDMEERERTIHMPESSLSRKQRIRRTSSNFGRVASEFGRLPSVVGWRDEIRKAEILYVQNPADVDVFLKKMAIMELPLHEKRMLVSHLAHQLIKDEIIAIPPLIWQRSSENEGDEDLKPTKDKLIMNRFGFLFIACEILPPYYYEQNIFT